VLAGSGSVGADVTTGGYFTLEPFKPAISDNMYYLYLLSIQCPIADRLSVLSWQEEYSWEIGLLDA